MSKLGSSFVGLVSLASSFCNCCLGFSVVTWLQLDLVCYTSQAICWKDLVFCTSQVIGWEDRHRNDLQFLEWDIIRLTILSLKLV